MRLHLIELGKVRKRTPGITFPPPSTDRMCAAGAADGHRVAHDSDETQARPQGLSTT
jgi:hypothetical protein